MNTTKETQIKKLGGEENYRAYMREIASRGKTPRENTTFYKDRELAKSAGSAGGKAKSAKNKNIPSR